MIEVRYLVSYTITTKIHSHIETDQNCWRSAELGWNNHFTPNRLGIMDAT